MVDETQNQEGFLHESGLTFIPPAVGEQIPGRRATAPTKSWGTLLNDAQFTVVETFQDALKTLDIVEEKAVAIKGADGWVKEKGYKAIVSKRSGLTYSIPTEKYHIVQDVEIVKPLVALAKESGLKPIGRVDGVGTGRTVGHVIFANPDFKVQILKAYNDPMMLGIKFWNSFNTESSFGAESFGVRMICCNYNVWGEILGKFAWRHSLKVKRLHDDYKDLLKGMIDSIPKIQQLAEMAVNKVIVKSEIPDLLWGIRLPVKGIEAISENVLGWCPEAEEGRMGLNNWTLYNATTAYITYRLGSGNHLPSTELHAKNAVELLLKNHDKIIEEGRKHKEAYEQRLKELEADRIKQKEKVKVVAQ